MNPFVFFFLIFLIACKGSKITVDLSTFMLQLILQAFKLEFSSNNTCNSAASNFFFGWPERSSSFKTKSSLLNHRDQYSHILTDGANTNRFLRWIGELWQPFFSNQSGKVINDKNAFYYSIFNRTKKYDYIYECSKHV